MQDTLEHVNGDEILIWEDEWGSGVAFRCRGGAVGGRWGSAETL